MKNCPSLWKILKMNAGEQKIQVRFRDLTVSIAAKVRLPIREVAAVVSAFAEVVRHLRGDNDVAIDIVEDIKNAD